VSQAIILAAFLHFNLHNVNSLPLLRRKNDDTKQTCSWYYKNSLNSSYPVSYSFYRFRSPNLYRFEKRTLRRGVKFASKTDYRALFLWIYSFNPNLKNNNGITAKLKIVLPCSRKPLEAFDNSKQRELWQVYFNNLYKHEIEHYSNFLENIGLLERKLSSIDYKNKAKKKLLGYLIANTNLKIRDKDRVIDRTANQLKLLENIAKADKLISFK
jgi:hypothetical protein